MRHESHPRLRQREGLNHGHQWMRKNRSGSVPHPQINKVPEMWAWVEKSGSPDGSRKGLEKEDVSGKHNRKRGNSKLCLGWNHGAYHCRSLIKIRICSREDSFWIASLGLATAGVCALSTTINSNIWELISGLTPDRLHPIHIVQLPRWFYTREKFEQLHSRVSHT